VGDLDGPGGEDAGGLTLAGNNVDAGPIVATPTRR
jgi:hypothetical protein